jgi:hypothetical protein
VNVFHVTGRGAKSDAAASRPDKRTAPQRLSSARGVDAQKKQEKSADPAGVSFALIGSFAALKRGNSANGSR